MTTTAESISLRYVVHPNAIILEKSMIWRWQRNYHEHIIRNQRAFDNIMLYIDENVERWNADCFNNHRI